MEVNIEKLIKEMTLKEKIGQLNLISFSDKVFEQIESGEIGSILNAYGYETIYKLQEAAQKSRLKIPLLTGDDVIHGFKTTYPVPLSEACSFNLDLIEETAYLSMMEARDEGINWIYAPMLDLITDPRFGRVMETSGEDPYLSSEIARRRVRGIQREVDGTITSASAKHYLGYGASEAGLDYSTSDFSEHKMRNYYLPQFIAAVDEGVLSIMHAFTTYNNLPVTMSKYLLKDVLRDELGFDGALVTDWQCLNQLIKFKTVRSDEEAALVGINAGIDLDMHTRIYHEYLELLVDKDPSLVGKIDESVRRVLTMKKKMGLFENPYPKRISEELKIDIKKHTSKVADESIILFKNEDNILPLDIDSKILVVGSFIDDQDIHLGAWSCKGRSEDVTSLRIGLNSKFTNINYFPISNDVENTDFSLLEAALSKTDYCVLALGEPRSYNGENNCRTKIDLPFNQDLLIDFIEKFNVPMIAIVTAGRPLAITNLDKAAKAIVWNFNLGHDAGNALARVLVGEVNPSAKTVLTFPKELGQVPIYYNKYNIAREELIQYLDGDIEPLYPFGYGLSYSKFTYNDFGLFQDNGTLNVEVDISNVSNVDGKEIIQVYLVTEYEATLAPRKRLIGFKKVFLEKNTNKFVKIELSFDNTKYPGDYSIQVGASSRDGIIKEL